MPLFLQLLSLMFACDLTPSFCAQTEDHGTRRNRSPSCKSFTWCMCMQALVLDYEQQTQSIVQSYNAAKAEEDIIQAAMHRHFAKCEAEQKLVYQTARAEAQNAASEEYNMLRISREAQVGRLRVSISHLQHRLHDCNFSLCGPKQSCMPYDRAK